MKIICITPHLKQDYLAQTVIEGLKEKGIDFYASDLGNGAEKAYSDDELMAIDADLCLVIWGKVTGGPEPKYHLVDKLSCPKYYIDGSEWSYTGNREPKQKGWQHPKGDSWLNLSMLSKCHKYFKRECYPEDLKQGIIPLSFGVMNDTIKPLQKKEYDVFCGFGQSATGLRKEVIKACEKVSGRVVIKNGISKEEYLDYVSKSRITVDAWGGGQINARMFEALANKSMLFTQKIDVILSAPLYEYVDYVPYTTNIQQELQYYINSPVTHKIATSGYNRAMQFHRTKHRIDEILYEINHL